MKKILFILFACLATVGNVRAEEITVWEGSQAGNLTFRSYDATYPALMGSGEGQANLSAGDVITISYTGASSGNHVYVQDGSWSTFSTLLTGIESDELTVGDGTYTFYVSQALVDKIVSTGGLILQRSGGSSYAFTKLTVTKKASDVVLPPTTEQVVYFGFNTESVDFRYHSERIAAVSAAELQPKDTIKVYLSNVDENDKIWIKETTDWSQMNSTDLLSAGQQVFKMPLTQNSVNNITSNKWIIQHGGYDYAIRYVTIAKYVPPIVPGYELLYEGEFYIDWSNVANYYVVPKDALSNLAVGDIIHAYGKPDTEHSQHKFCWNKTNVNGSVPNARLVSGTQNVSEESHFELTITDEILNTINENDLVISGYWFYLTKLYIEHPNRFVSVTMSADGLATFSHATEAIDLSWVDGLKAYKATVSGEKIVTELVTGTVAANTGLILQGENNATYRIPFAISGTALTDNVLVPTDGNPVTGYVLGHTTTGGTAFYKVSNKAVAAGKAYIPENAMTARQLSIDLLGDETTGISTMHNSECIMHNEVYNLQGQRVSAGAKGLVIVNGKKVFNK